MSAVARLEQQLPLVLDEFYARSRAAEASRQNDRDAAVTFQSAWRGYFLRQQINHIGQVATTIQRCWRGYVGRQRFAHARELQDQQLRKAYFDANATTIQKWWRGFFSRKHIHNYYARKAYLAAVRQQNDAVRANMEQEMQQAMQQQRHAAAESAKAQFDAHVSRLGHLMSTASRPGVFSSPYDAVVGTLPVVAGLTLEEHLRSSSKKQGAALVTLARQSPQRRASPGGSPTATAYAQAADSSARLSLRQVAPYEAVKEEKALEARIVRGQMIATHGTPFVSSMATLKLPFSESQSLRGTGCYGGGADAIMASMQRKTGHSTAATGISSQPFEHVTKKQPFFDKSITQGY